MVQDEPSLLIVSGAQGDSRRYRTFHLYEQACLAGLNCQLSHVTDPDLRKKVERSQVVILHRASFDAQISWLEQEVHHKGGVLIQDIDDLIFDPDAVRYIHSHDFSDPVRLSLYTEDIYRYQKTLDCCDYVITPCEYLANRIHELGKEVLIHRNAFSLEMLALSDKAYLSIKTNPDKIAIGYASGTPTHDQDFALIKPALRSVLDHHPNVELWLVGPLHPGRDWESMTPQTRKLKRVPWRKLPELQVRFDINLAPLEIDNPFGQSKSEIKYVEAALTRVPTIASPSEAFLFAIRQSDTGYLAHDLQEWEEYLEELVSDPELRDRIGENAHQDVLQRYHPAVRSCQLVDTLNSITQNKYGFQFNPQDVNQIKKKQPQFYWSSVKIERSPNLLQRGLYTIRYRNMRTLIKQIWIFVRRSISPLYPF